MIIFKKIVFIILIFVSYSNNSCGQFRYFFKLFETKDKKFVELIEENSRKERQIIKKIEDEKAYNDYNSKLKEEGKTEIAIRGIYKTREEFLLLKPNSIEDDLRRKAIEIMSRGSKSGAEELTVTKAFSKTGLLSPDLQNKQTIKKILLSRERNSLINVKKVQVYLSIPETPDEFKNIFKTTNNQQLKYSKQLKQKIANETNGNIHFLTSADLLTKDIINSPDNMPIILIGHNESGEFRLPDGSGKKFENMDSLANTTERSIIYLSCNSNNFTNNPAAPFYLTYNDGIAITNKINNALLKNISVNSDNQQTKKILNNIIQTYGKEKKQKFQYKVVAYSIAISGIGYTFYEIKQSDSK